MLMIPLQSAQRICVCARERVKMGDVQTYEFDFVPAIQILDHMYGREELLHFRVPVRTTVWDLYFFRLLFWGLECWEGIADDSHVASLVGTVGRELTQTVKEFAKDYAVRRGRIGKWERWASPLMTKIRDSKPLAVEICVAFLGASEGFETCEFYDDEVACDDTGNFIDFMLYVLRNCAVMDRMAPVWQQFEFIQGKLEFFRELLQLVR